jgi:hypothetical protein
MTYRNSTISIEVRNMIYQEVARGAIVTFTWRARVRLSTCGALLVCSKQVNTEFLPILLKHAQIDLSQHIDRKTGVIQLPGVKVAAVQHVKLSPDIFATGGAASTISMVSQARIPISGVTAQIYQDSRRKFTRSTAYLTLGA